MPNISVPLVETNKAAIRPALLDITRQVMEITQIPSTTRINYRGDADGVAQKGSGLQDGSERDNIQVSSQDTVTIEVDAVYDENTFASTAVSQSEHLPVLMDEELGVIFRPVYARMECIINFVYKTRSRTMAERWRDDIRVRVSQMRDVNLHDIEYHMPVPYPFVNLLQQIYKQREAVAGYGESMPDYLRKVMTSRLTEISNFSGERTMLTISEKQTRVQGYFDFTGVPEKANKNSENSAWTIGFAYSVAFDCPISMHASYPVMVHNEFLPEKFIPPPARDDDRIRKSFSRSGTALNHFEIDNFNSRSHYPLQSITIPDFDEFVANTAPPDMHRLISVLCQVDPNDPKALIKLDELGEEYQFDPTILKFIKSEVPYLTTPYRSIFYVTVYRWKYLTSHEDYVIDADLNLSFKEDLSMRKNYRVAFMIVRDLMYLHPSAIKRLAQNPEAFRKILMYLRVPMQTIYAIYRKVNISHLFPKLQLDPHELKKYLDAHVGFNTVGIAGIVTYKRSLYPGNPTHPRTHHAHRPT